MNILAMVMLRHTAVMDIDGLNANIPNSRWHSVQHLRNSLAEYVPLGEEPLTFTEDNFHIVLENDNGGFDLPKLPDRENWLMYVVELENKHQSFEVECLLVEKVYKKAKVAILAESKEEAEEIALKQMLSLNGYVWETLCQNEIERELCTDEFIVKGI